MLRFFVCSRACEEAFPPRLRPEAYNDIRWSAIMSDMEEVQYKKMKCDLFWCAQMREKAMAERNKWLRETKKRQNEESGGQNLSNAQIDESDSEP